MRFKFTAFLLVLNVLAFGLILFLNKRAENADLRNSNLATVIGRELVEATRIELRGKTLENPRVLELDGNTWRITAPMQWSANFFAVNRILNQLQFLEEQAAFSIDEVRQTGQTLEDYGLADPLLTLEISNEEDSIDLSIGAMTEIGNNVYLLGPDEETIFVVSREVIDSLLIDLGDLRTREIFDIPVFEVDSLSLQIRETDGGEVKVRLAKTTDGWAFEAPLSAKADPALVATTINALTTAKVGRFIEPEANDPVLQGLENPALQITLHGNKRRQTLLIGNVDEASTGESAFFAKLEGNPTVFTVSSESFKALKQAEEALRNRQILSFEREALNSINISGNERELRLQMIETGEWQVIESAETEDLRPLRADDSVVSDLIDDLVDLRAISFAFDDPTPADLERLGFNEPRRTLTLVQNDGATQKLTLAHPADENELLYARTDAAPFVYRVDRRATLESFPLNQLHYRDRALESLPKAATVTSIRLEDLASDLVFFEYSLGSPEILWAEALEGLEEAEKDAVLAIIEHAVRSLRAQTYLPGGYEDPYLMGDGTPLPWRYRVVATVLLPGGDPPKTETLALMLSERLAGSLQVAGSERLDTVYSISQELLDAVFVYTGKLALPPEATGQPVPAQEAPEPLPDPRAEPESSPAN